MDINYSFYKKDVLDYHRKVTSSDPGGQVYHAVWVVSLDHFDTTVFRPVKVSAKVRAWEVSASILLVFL